MRKLTKAQEHMPNVSEAIQYPLPPGPVHPWINRVLNAYLKDSETLRVSRALASKGERG